MKKNIIITGNPRSGKSTLLWNVVSVDQSRVGFVTHEVREADERIGFEIETHSGKRIMLASTKLRTDFRVSKYFVNTKNLDSLISLVSQFGEKDLLYLDEIGQMELASEHFKLLALKYLNSKNTCVATLTKVFSDDFTKQIKTRNDIVLVEITEENREQKQKFIKALIKKIDKARKYIKEPERFFVAENVVRLTSAHATRTLHKVNAEWECDCNFFVAYRICSHTIALEEYLEARSAS